MNDNTKNIKDRLAEGESAPENQLEEYYFVPEWAVPYLEKCCEIYFEQSGLSFQERLLKWYRTDEYRRYVEMAEKTGELMIETVMKPVSDR